MKDVHALLIIHSSSSFSQESKEIRILLTEAVLVRLAQVEKNI